MRLKAQQDGDKEVNTSVEQVFDFVDNLWYRFLNVIQKQRTLGRGNYTKIKSERPSGFRGRTDKDWYLLKGYLNGLIL